MDPLRKIERVIYNNPIVAKDIFPALSVDESEPLESEILSFDFSTYNFYCMYVRSLGNSWFVDIYYIWPDDNDVIRTDMLDSSIQPVSDSQVRNDAAQSCSMNILSDGSSRFLNIIILCQIGFLILEASKPALNHDIVRPAAFSIHALADAVFFYEINVLLTGKLTSLVRIQYLWFGLSMTAFLRR